RHFALELDNRQIQLAGPEVQTIPVHLSLDPLHQRMDMLFGPFQRPAMFVGITAGQVFHPEMGVKMQVQKGAVHVQQDGINGVPVKHVVWVLNEWAVMITNHSVTTEPACRKSQTSSMPALSRKAACLPLSRCSCV